MAGSGPVSSQGGDPLVSTQTATGGMFDSPMGLGGVLWQSMGDGVKDFGSSANKLGGTLGDNLGENLKFGEGLKFDPVNGLKNLGDSALNFNPVDSMKKLGESASTLGESAINFNPAKKSMHLLPQTNLFGGLVRARRNTLVGVIIYIHVFIQEHRETLSWVYICRYLYVYIYIYICTCVYVYMYLYVYAGICVYTYVYVNIYI